MLLARLVAVGWAGMSVFGSTAPPAGESGERAVLFFFNTPESDAGPRAARVAKAFIGRHDKEVRLRPVLLAQDFRTLRTLTDRSPLYQTIKELEAGSKPGSLDIPLYDEEGLRLAEHWGIRSVPAFVLVRAGRAHCTAGAAANLEMLWECLK